MKTIQEILDMDIHYGRATKGGLYDLSLNLVPDKLYMIGPISPFAGELPKGFHYDIWTQLSLRSVNKYVYIV